jgi:hypothetical protein
MEQGITEEDWRPDRSTDHDASGYIPDHLRRFLWAGFVLAIRPSFCSNAALSSSQPSRFATISKESFALGFSFFFIAGTNPEVKNSN